MSTAREFNKKQLEEQTKLLEEQWKTEKNHKPTKEEKELFALKYMRTDIKHNSLYFRIGAIGALDRAIKSLEKQIREKEEQKATNNNIEKAEIEKSPLRFRIGGNWNNR